MTRALLSVVRSLALCLAALLWLAGCATAPETGRRQSILVTPAQETELDIAAFAQMKQAVPINRNPALNAILQRVGKRIAAVAPLANPQWEFVVFESKEPNAFFLPGGKVGI